MAYTFYKSICADMRMARKDVHSMKIRAYKSHFGMVVSSVIAICVSFVMAASAIVVDQLTFTLPLFVRNWGTAFLVITLTGMAFPLTPWAWTLCRKWNIKPETLPHILIENAVNNLLLIYLFNIICFTAFNKTNML